MEIQRSPGFAVIPPHDIDERLDAIRHHIDAVTELPANHPGAVLRDRIMRSAAVAVRETIGTGLLPELDDVVRQEIAGNPRRDPNGWMNYFIREGQYEELEHGGVDSLRRRTTPDTWLDTLQRINDDPAKLERLRRHSKEGVRTNVSSRGAPVQAIMALRQPEEPQNIFEGGCSDNQIGNKLAGRKWSPYPDYHRVDFMEPSGPGGKLEIDPHQTDIVKSMLLDPDEESGMRVPIANVVGVDLQELPKDPHSPKAIEQLLWGIACHYGFEIAYDPERIAEFEYFHYNKAPNVHFHQNNLLDWDAGKFEAEYGDVGSFDMAVFSMVVYQLGVDGFMQALGNVLPYLKQGHRDPKRNACIVVNEHAYVDDDGHLVLFDKWSRGKCRTFVCELGDYSKIEDPRELRFEEVIRWENGRMAKGLWHPNVGRRYPLARELGLRSGRGYEFLGNTAVKHAAA